MKVLMLGQHLELGLYRAEFLRTHGYEVIFPEGRKQALAAIREGTFDIVLLSYSLSNETSQALLELIDQRCPSCPVIGITEQRWSDRNANLAEAVLVSEGPEGLLAALNRAGNARRSNGLRRLK